MPNIATRTAYGKALLKLGQENENIVILDADLQGSVKHNEFAKAFPEKSFNIGIAEKDMVGTAAGLAIAGKIPFAASFAVFTTGEGYNTIRQSICYSHLPVKLVGSHAGILTGEDGATHQALEDIGIMRCLPHMEVYSPADAYETEAIVHAVAERLEPCYIRLGRENTPTVHHKEVHFTPGKAFILKQGMDLAIFSHGSTVPYCLEAAHILEQEDINIAVISNPSLKPFDHDTLIKIAKKTGKILVVEDHSISGGLGSIIAEILAEEGHAKLYRHGMTGFGESGTSQDLYKKYELDAAGIAKKVRQILR